MIKNRKVQLVYLAMACTAGLFGVFASVGFFEASFRWDFYIFFTNISNYLCVAIMFMELVQVFRSNEDGHICIYPKVKFMGLVAILLTFLMFNIFLAPSKSLEYLLSIRNLSLHVFIPILYVVDWFLFYERKKIDWKYPLVSLVFLGGYMLFVFIHGAILKFDTSISTFAGTDPLVYPYFFLNYEKLGVGGLLKWVLLIILAFFAIGYLFYLLDKLDFKKKGHQ